MNRNFRRSFRIGGLIWLFLGIAVCIGAIKLKLGNFHRPGSGFMPFLSGAFLVLLGLILMLSAIPEGSYEKEEVKVEKILAGGKWKTFLSTILALFGYVILLNPLGFLPTTFLFLFFLFELTNPKRWWRSMIFSGVAVIISYLIFSVWLRCQFPKGILAF